MTMVNASVLDSSIAGSPPQSPTAQGTSTTLKSAHVFEVVSQIPLGKKGTYLTAKLSPLNRHRLISVEVHRVLPSFEDETSTSGGKIGSSSSCREAETCYVRIFQPASTFLGMGSDAKKAATAGKKDKRVKSAAASDTTEKDKNDEDEESIDGNSSSNESDLMI